MHAALRTSLVLAVTLAVVILVPPARAQQECLAEIVSHTGGKPLCIDGTPNRVYIGLDKELRVVDTSAAPAISILGSILLPEDPYQIDVSGSYAYIRCANSRFLIVNLTNPASMTIAFSVPTWDLRDIHVAGTRLYTVTNARALNSYDITAPASPVLLGTYAPAGFLMDHVEVQGGTVFVAGDGDKVRSLNMTNAAVPVVLDTITLLSPYWDSMDTRAGMLAISRGDLVSILNIANPSAMSLHVVLPSRIGGTIVSFGESGGVPTLYYQNLAGALRCVSLANPAAPVAESAVQPPVGIGPNPLSYTFDAAGSRLYSVGLLNYFIDDLTVPSAPAPLLSVGFSPAQAQLLGVVNNHLVTLEDSTIRTYNIADPTHPVLADAFILPIDVSASCLDGARGYFAAFDGAFRVYDFTNPVAPVSIGSGTVDTAADFLLADGATLYLKDGTDLFVYDVSDPNTPVEVGTRANLPYGPMFLDDGILLTGGDLDPVKLYDATNPVDLQLLSTIQPGAGEGFEGFTYHDGTICTIPDTFDNPPRVGLYDVRDPANPLLRSTFVSQEGDNAIFLGGLLAVAGNDELRFSDVTRPSSPTLLSTMIDEGEFGYAWDTTQAMLAHNGTLWASGFDLGIFAVHIPEIPRVETSTQDAALCGGGVSTFAVTLQNPVGANYQWRRNGVNLTNGVNGAGTTIAGVTTPTLTLTTPHLADLGDYDCVIANFCGTVTTRTSQLVVSVAPTIIQQPDATEACPQGAFTLTTGWLGTNPATIQWEWQRPAGSGPWEVIDDGLRPRFNVSGAHTRFLTIEARPGETLPPAFVEANYRCTVANACGTATSQVALVTIAQCDCVDFNKDTLYPDIQDVADFLSVFSGGVCAGQLPTDPPCNTDIDFNNDTLFPDTDDITTLLRVFAGGPCA